MKVNKSTLYLHSSQVAMNLTLAVKMHPVNSYNFPTYVWKKCAMKFNL